MELANSSNRRHRLLMLMSLTWLIAQSGCQQRATYQVSGRVQYQDGSPIVGGVRVIRFEPTEDTTAEIRKAASGNIASDGSFELFTRKPGDGVIAGKYAVTFSVLTSPMDPKPLIPEKYSRAMDTPFDIVVDDDKTDLLFELEKL